MKTVQAHDLPLAHLRSCQVCASEDLELVLDLGHHPPCDSLLAPAQLQQEEKTYPLRFLRCRSCGLAQIDYVVAPEVLFFPKYPYRSGITGTLAAYLRSIAPVVVRSMGLAKGSLVIDIGSNDGTLLEGFKAQGMRVLGVEGTDIAKIATRNGIPTLQAFFGQEVARRIRRQHGAASVITATNVFAHVSNLGELVLAVGELLPEGGLFLTESHYLLDLVETVQYDSIYHEHLKYYSLKPLIHLMDAYDFTVVDAERIPNYGGSIRVFAKKGRGHPTTKRLAQLVREEERAGLYEGTAFRRFAQQARRSKLELQELLVRLRKAGKRVVGVGCPGRASTLLNYCRIDPDLIPYIAEQSTSLKLGLHVPGVHIPVVDERIMFEEQPEYVLMLSWHYSEPIRQKLRQRGLRSKFILPLPRVQVLDD